MIAEPIINYAVQMRPEGQSPIPAAGQSFCIEEWRGSGPGYLHVHHADDEAWHVLEGTLTFRFPDRQVEAPAGTTVFVPAGVPHDYFVSNGPARYLIIMTPRLRALISALQAVPFAQHKAVMKQFDSDIVE